MKKIFYTGLIILIVSALGFTLSINNFVGKWEYRVHYSTLGGGGAMTEIFIFYFDSTFEYSMKGYNYSKKKGLKKHRENYKGNFKVQNGYLIFYNVKKSPKTKNNMTPRWKIVSFSSSKVKLKPVASRRDGGYPRFFVRK